MDIIENEFIKFWRKETIIFGALKKTIYLDVEECKGIIELRHRISNNEPQYCCMDYSNVKSATMEAHDYLDKNGQDFVHAFAAVVNSFMVKFLVELYMRMHKPRVPMKIFTTQESAVEWLKEIQKTKNIETNV